MSSRSGGARRAASNASAAAASNSSSASRQTQAAQLEAQAQSEDDRADRLSARAEQQPLTPERVAYERALASRDQNRATVEARGAGGMELSESLLAAQRRGLMNSEAALRTAAENWQQVGGHPEYYEWADTQRRLADAHWAQANALRGANSATVHYESEASRRALAAVMGRNLTRAEIADLAGGVPGGVVYVRPGYNGSVGLQAAGPHSFNAERIYRDATGALVVHNDFAHNDLGSRTAGSGRTVLHSLAAMRDQGISRVEAVAARADASGIRGYETWPKIGANGPLPQSVAAAARSAFGPGVRTVQDVIAQPGGRAWWRVHGNSFDATFDLRPGGATRAILDQMTSRGNGNGNGSNTRG
jgi:hypothetical protein